jgi:antitoxin component of RelBE/YafQ-DinJ toxin-antitoxin module
MLDSLSLEQKIAFDALNLGPVWVSKESAEQTQDQAQAVVLAMVFQSNVESHSDAQNMLLEQIFRAAKLPFEQAQAFNIRSIKTSAQFETLLCFAASEQIDALLEKQAVQITTRIDLPSLAAIASDGKSKVLAWKAVKAFLLSQR